MRERQHTSQIEILQENKITVGVNTIKINEDFTPPDDVKPGDVIMKNPSVECVKEDGAVDCYVRMYCEYADSTAEDITDIDFNTTDWTPKQDDGYYYYKKKLLQGSLQSLCLQRLLLNLKKATVTLLLTS